MGWAQKGEKVTQALVNKRELPTARVIHVLLA
jgi:hypothetical protein